MRLKKDDKIKLARAIRDKALNVVSNSSEFEKLHNHPAALPIATIENLQIAHTTPFMKLSGAPAPYGMDIWDVSGCKVFSVWWEPFEIVMFKYREWMNILVPKSYDG